MASRSASSVVMSMPPVITTLDYLCAESAEAEIIHIGPTCLQPEHTSECTEQMARGSSGLIHQLVLDGIMGDLRVGLHSHLL